MRDSSQRRTLIEELEDLPEGPVITKAIETIHTLTGQRSDLCRAKAELLNLVKNIHNDINAKVDLSSISTGHRPWAS